MRYSVLVIVCNAHAQTDEAMSARRRSRRTAQLHSGRAMAAAKTPQLLLLLLLLWLLLLLLWIAVVFVDYFNVHELQARFIARNENRRNRLVDALFRSPSASDERRPPLLRCLGVTA